MIVKGPIKMAELPVNLEDLLRHRTVESDRIEYKTGWNPAPVINTLCAFANDFENLGGGYLIIGQDCDADGVPIFPPTGLNDNQLDKIQQDLLRCCKMMQPEYYPVLSVEKFEGKNLIVLWAPGGQNRPYKAPRDVNARHKEYHYYIRRYANTVQVVENSEDQQELLSLAAKIPFDDRRCIAASIDDLKLALIKDYLKEVGSALDPDKYSFLDLCRQMKIVDGGNEFVKPRNAGVLFFSDHPSKFLPGAQIDVVIFPKGAGGGELIEKTFAGPIHEQVTSALRYIQNEALQQKVIKRPDRAEATRISNYPYAAIEEALVNAVYHRSYEQSEPVEVRIHPDRIEIVSYPGPDASIRIEALNGEQIVARRYRNRRIGDFLKDLDLTEGRGTGIPTMRKAMSDNGSANPEFKTDDDRTYFFAKLLVHPDMPGVMVEDQQPEEVAEIALSDSALKILKFLANGPKRKVEIAEFLDVSRRTGSFTETLESLRNNGLIELTIPEKPTSSRQQYRLSMLGKKHIQTL